MTPTIGSIVAKKFQLVRELGRGSMGTVWLADHLTLDVRCAVKFMTGDAARDPNFLARFEFEARAVAQLQSPYVVRVLDYAVDDDVPFMAMEYLQGEDLCARLARVGRLDAVTTFRIISQTARGLAKAHLAGLVHRDLKPENIFLAQEDDEETAKLLDFGVAKSTAFAVNGTATQVGSLLGTPAYMSPEQARGLREVDHRSDLWSLAVITYQCLTGRLPFDSPTLGDLFGLIMYEPIPVPSKVAPWLPPEFDAWWARAAVRDVEQRFSSAREMADALARALQIAGPGETLRGGYVPSSAFPPPRDTLPPSDVVPVDDDERITSTHTPFTRSLRGARHLIRSPRARYVAACSGVIGAVFLFATFAPKADDATSHSAAAVPPSAPVVIPAAARAVVAPAPKAEPPAPPHEAQAALAPLPVPVEQLPEASQSNGPSKATSSADGRAAGRSRSGASAARSAASASPAPHATPHKAHSATKGSSDDVDFGI